VSVVSCANTLHQALPLTVKTATAKALFDFILEPPVLFSALGVRRHSLSDIFGTI
jgi:hypothetical protein